MDEHRKRAEEIANKFSYLFAITGGGTYSSWYRLIDEMENALRTTASKSEKDGYRKGVEDSVKVAENYLMTEKQYAGISRAIRRLIGEEVK